jgi:adenylate cyclase
VTVASRIHLLRPGSGASDPEERLEGWKQIAAYLKRDVRTVQRWARSEQLPVRRQLHHKLSSALASKKEIDQWMEQRCSLPRTEPPRSLAVRYFDSFGKSDKYAYFCEAIAEDLITSLSKTGGLRVFPRSTMASFRKKSLTAVSLGKRLGASHVLEGTVRRAQGRVRLSVELVETRRGHAVWAEQYDTDAKEIFLIQDDITNSIAGALQLKLLRTPGRTSERGPITDLRALDLYFKGRQLFHQFRRKNFERAREMFARAVELDPQFAGAHAGLADCCSYLYLYWDPRQENLQAADLASRRAIELAPKLAEAHASRAVALSTLRDYPEAKKEFQTAIGLDPGLYEAHYFYGRACLAQGKYRDAIQPFQLAARARPEDYQALSLLAMAYSGLGRKAEAAAAHARTIEVAKQELSVNPGDVRALYLGAISWARIGRKKEALAWAAKALALDSEDSAVLYNVACLYAVLHRTEEALTCLRRVVRSGWRKEWIQNDPDLSSLRNNPEFQRLLA